MPPETIEKFEVRESEKPVISALPTREEAKAQGLTADELERAEKRGMLSKPTETPKSEPKPDEKAPEPKAEEKTSEKPKVDQEAKPKGNLPDFTFKTPEQEKAFLDAFGAGTPQRAMYFRMKNERQARQNAEQERDKEKASREALEARIAALESGKPVQEVDENGNPIDPEDKPLTLKQLRELQKAEAYEQEQKRQANETKARKLAEAQQSQEEYARTIYEDFDDTVNKAKEVMKNIDALLPERWQQAKAIKLIRDLQIAAAHADQIDLDEYHAAHIAYEIGRLHPDYGKSADTPDASNGDTPDKDGKPSPTKANGGLTPEQMKRIEENTQRRASSASIPGGGSRRTISADEVDAMALNKMSYAERQRFREKYPDRYAQLLRG